MKIELAHDSLAKKIYDMASTEDKMLIKVHQFIGNRLVYYLDSGVLLDRDSLNYIAPYATKLTLNKEEQAFVNKSYRIDRRNRRIIQSITLITCLVLLGFGVQATQTFYGLQKSIKKKKYIVKKLSKTRDKRKLAEFKAQRLLEESEELSAEDWNDLDDIEVIKQMIIQYDTLGKQQANAIKQRDVAQSATLSDLAKTAKNQNDEKYAFQLAVKAWELNNNNDQALEVIEDLSKQKKVVALSQLPVEEQVVIIKQEVQRKGKLKDQDLEVIFAKENTVVHKSNAKTSVKKIVQSTKETTKKSSPKKNAIKAPAIYQIIQQKNNQIQPIEQKIQGVIPASNELKLSSCALIQNKINKWITVKKTTGFDILASFGSDKNLYFKLNHKNPVTTNSPLQLKLIIDQSIANPLIRKKGTNNKYFYVTDLSTSDKKLLKQKKITGLWLSTPKKNRIGQKEPDKKVVFPPDIQLKLLTMSKCLL